MGECFFWYRLTRVVPDRFHRAIKRSCVCVCVCVLLTYSPPYILNDVSLITTEVINQLILIITSPPKVIWEEPHHRPLCREWTHLLHSSAACATGCTMPTVDESSHSATSTLHLHHSATFFLYVRPTMHCPFPFPLKNLQLPIGDPHLPLKKVIHHPNDIIIIHTLNYCDYFCTINWSELVYGHFSPWTHRSVMLTFTINLTLTLLTRYPINSTTTTG